MLSDREMNVFHLLGCLPFTLSYFTAASESQWTSTTWLDENSLAPSLQRG